MSAPVGTVVTNTNNPLFKLLTGDDPTFTKVAEGVWQHNHEDAPKSAADGEPYASAIDELEAIVAGTYAEDDKDDYTVALPAEVSE